MPAPFTLTPDQRDDFDRTGLVHLPAFYAAGVVAPMADALWRDLETRYRLDRRDPRTWKTVERGSHFQALERSGAFDGLDTPELTALADAFLGAGTWDKPRRWGQPLVTFPTSGECALPNKVWHVDYRTLPSSERLGAIRLFVFLEPVRSQGGTTLYAAGSHRVAQALADEDGRSVRSQDVRRRLKQAHPWFDLLLGEGPDRAARLARGAQVRGARVELGEMTGEPGDVIVMHPNMLHGLSQNVLARPRLALVQSLMRRDATYF